MRRFGAITAAIAVTGVLMTTAAAALEAPLTYERHPDNPKTFRPIGHAMFQILDEPPEGEWKLPEFTGPLPLYIIANLGDKQHLLVFDCEKKEDDFYNRFYFDADADGDITDDPVIEGTVDEQGRDRYSLESASMDVTITVDGKETPYSFKMYLSGGSLPKLLNTRNATKNLSNRFYGYFTSNCSYSCELSIDGSSYRLLFSDSNVNGRFDDGIEQPPEQGFPGRQRLYFPHDGVYISDAGGTINNEDSQVHPDILIIKDRVFEAHPDFTGGSITLTEMKNGLVPLKLGMGAERLSLASADYSSTISVFKPGGSIMVPPGDYRLLVYQALKKDEQGDLWRVSAAASNESKIISAGNSGGALDFGEPYLPSIEIPELLRKTGSGTPSRVSLNLIVEGANGEIIFDVGRIEGTGTKIPLSKYPPGNMPKEPTYRVVKSDGEIVAKGNFEYG